MSKPLIMIVDDEKEVADNLASFIKNTGRYEAIAAYDGKEGLEKLKSNKIALGLGGNRINLILLDIKMPEMDGLQFLEKVRKDYGENIGIMMVTAYEDEKKWDKATDGFVVGYVKKPINQNKLMAAIDRYFSCDNERAKMTLETFEEHIDKRDTLKKEDN